MNDGAIPIQTLCEQAQAQLVSMDYLAAEATLASAEEQAWAARDWDSLSRLYMPLQEARRQRRQRCGEGAVCLDLLAQDANDRLDARHVVQNFPQGQLLVAGWGTLAPSFAVRAFQARKHLYVETFLAAVFPVVAEGDGDRTARAVVLCPEEGTPLPEPAPRPIDALILLLPPGCIVLPESHLPARSRRGTPETYGQVMALWEKLHAPFLAAADAESDPLRKIEAYRRAIRVDYACERAHQGISQVARNLLRTGGVSV